MQRRIITRKNNSSGDSNLRNERPAPEGRAVLFFLFHYGALTTILAVASVLLFTNLDDHYLWQDEAETALVGKTVLSGGLPVATDGMNSFSQDIAGDEGKYEVWRLHPWLQFYVVAGSFALLGPGTFSARLPFALFGIAILIATYLFTRDIFRSGPIALIASGLLAISIPFILLCRQSRYYSLLIFFSLMACWMYFHFMQRKQYALPLLIASATLCFHSFYPGLLLLPAAMVLHAAVFYRDRIRSLLGALAAVALINFPWFLWFRFYPGVRRNVYHPARILDQLVAFGSEIAEFVFTPWLFGVILILAAVRYLNPRKPEIAFRAWWNPVFFLVSFILINIAVFSIPMHTFFRYISPALPFFAVLAALIVYAAFRTHLLFGAAVLALLVWVQPLAGYYHEMTGDYNGPMEGVIQYLNANAKSSDIVLITYGDLTLKFYTKLRVLGGYTGENLEPARKADWVIIRKHVNSPYEEPVRRFIRENIALSNYEKITIDYPDLAFENRESPRLHRFNTARDEDRVVIYKKRSVK